MDWAKLSAFFFTFFPNYGILSMNQRLIMPHAMLLYFATGAARHAFGGPQPPKGTEKKKDVKAEPKPVKDTITIYIVADDSRKLDKAVHLIQEYIDEEFHSEVNNFLLTQNILLSII